jgi:hypothetical protein
MTEAKITQVKHPQVRVKFGNLRGPEGNAWAIMGVVRRALRDAGLGDEVEAYMTEAQSGSYDNLLSVTGHWVTVL